MTNNETKKDLTQDLITNIDNIGSVLTKLERADFLLNELLEDYTFIEEPNPTLLSGNITEENLIERRQTLKWVFQYGRILKFLDIAKEYASNCRADIEHISNNLHTVLDTLKNTTSEEAV